MCMTVGGRLVRCYISASKMKMYLSTFISQLVHKHLSNIRVKIRVQVPICNVLRKYSKKTELAHFLKHWTQICLTYKGNVLIYNCYLVFRILHVKLVIEVLNFNTFEVAILFVCQYTCAGACFECKSTSTCENFSSSLQNVILFVLLLLSIFFLSPASYT